MTLGEIIARRREELGLTTEELGELVGIQRSAVSKYELDKIEDPPASKIKKFAAALDIPIFVLLDAIPTEEERLLYAYRRAERPIRRAALQMLEDSAGIVREQHEKEEGSF